MLAIVAFFTWTTEREVRRVLLSDMKVVELVADIDQAPSLTRLVSSIIRSNDPIQQTQYDHEAKFISDSIQAIAATTLDPTIKATTLRWIEINNKLIELEIKSMALSRSGQYQEASNLLNSREYDEMNNDYIGFQRQVRSLADRRFEDSRESIQNRSFHVIIVIGFVFVTLGLAWVYTINTVNSYIKDRQKLIDQMKSLTERDALTGIYNRHGLMNEAKLIWKTSQRINQHVALFFIDMDRLKPINDEFGHEVGDNAIKGMAEILRNTFRESDILGRLGGDEFAVIAPLENPTEAPILEKRLAEKMKEYNESSGHPFEISMSYGLKVCTPVRILLSKALSEADELMYEHKRSRKKLRDC